MDTKSVMRALLPRAMAVLLASTAYGASARAAAPNDIIWDPPKTSAPAPSAAKAPPPPGGLPDKNGIIWHTPGAPSSAPAPPSQAGASPPDAGIVWNTPAKSGAPSPPRVAAASTPSAAGPCHEFQTTIVIDGQKQPAHGTVCQQPDGTWRVVDK